MPRTQPAVEDVSRTGRRGPREQGGRIRPQQLVISAEHASNRIPARYNHLGLTRSQLGSHIAWDPGTKAIARACAKLLGCPCHEGRYSRLLVDLNRSLSHPKLMARGSFSVSVPGNKSLSQEERESRVRLYYEPFRNAVRNDIERIAGRYGVCIHLSMHSFTPVVDNMVRNADVGILYDPRRQTERRLAGALIERIAAAGFQVRRNYPYRGVNDGHTTHLRKQFSGSSYAGLEIEVNQNLLQTAAGIRRISRNIADIVSSLRSD